MFIFVIDKNFDETKMMIKSPFVSKIKHGPYSHPGFLSFGSVSKSYTLISPLPLFCFDAHLRLVE